MSASDSSTPLGRVRERLTSAALLLLGTWFVASLLLLPGLDHKTVAEWLRSAGGAVPMALFVIAVFIHAVDGLKVVVDDYVHDAGNNFFLNGLILFAGIGGAALALFSLAKIAFGAPAA